MALACKTTVQQNYTCWLKVYEFIKKKDVLRSTSLIFVYIVINKKIRTVNTVQYDCMRPNY